MFIHTYSTAVGGTGPYHRFLALYEIAPHYSDTCVFMYVRTYICIDNMFYFPQPITVGNGPLEQPLVYEVFYNGTRQNVTSSTTTLTFPAPSLSDGVFVDNITVIVTAINRFGRGTPSDPESFEISKLHIHNFMYVHVCIYVPYKGILIATMYVQHLCICMTIHNSEALLSCHDNFSALH